MDKEQLKEEPKDWEFRSKPTWQRLIIMIGGVNRKLNSRVSDIYNDTNIWGDAYISNDKITYGAHLSNPSYRSMDLKKEI